MRIYHYKSFYFSNYKNKLFTGATRLEVIRKALNELSLYQTGFLTL
jgi:hypothetical protein